MHAIQETRHVGLTWDHPRGYGPLDAAAGRDSEAGLRWDRQPLEGFESHPIGELAARYDLLVLDHPHIGEAVALDCLAPLEAFFQPELIASWAQQSAGHAMASYAWAGRHWALPIDIATQVMASRPDLLEGPPPQNWPEISALAADSPVALSTAGPHAFLCLLSIAAGLGEPLGDDEPFLSPSTIEGALSILADLHRRTPAWTRALNPIELLEAMSWTDDLALVPLIYGYVGYARADQPGHRPVSFTNAPAGSTGRPGSVLGGTGIAITRRARPDQALLEHLAWLMSSESQRDFIPRHGGQPASRTAWEDRAVNQASGNFYRATLPTIEHAMIRPRFDGYIAFQTQASANVRSALQGEITPSQLTATLHDAWHEARAAARGPKF